MTHFAKWRNSKRYLQNDQVQVDIRAVIKYFCKRGMLHKEIHKDFMEILWKECFSYSTVKNGQHSLRGRGRALRMMDGLAAQKMLRLMKLSRSCTSWL